MKQMRLSLGGTYAISFIILAIWASFAYYTMHSLIDSQEEYGTLINLSGKQRMLSQKNALYAHLVFEHGSEKLDHLKSLIVLMKQDHAFITSHLPSDALRHYYFQSGGLDSQVQHYFGLLDAFVLNSDRETLDRIIDASAPLLERLDQAVTIFETENSTIVMTLEKREQLIYFGTLMTLVLEAIIIVLPMIRLHKNYLTELESAVAQRTKELEIFKRIFDNSHEGMMITDADERILKINHAFSVITGFSVEEVLGQTPKILQSGKQSPDYYRQMWNSINRDNIWQGELVNRRKDGKEVYELVTILKLSDAQEINYVSIFSDISERIFHQEQLSYMASHDSLTGLFNRNEVLLRLNHALDLSERTKKIVAVLFIDLDNFKIVNDSMGHSIGDRLLFEISKRLVRVVRKSDTLGRIGGDEFIILVESLPQKGDEGSLLQDLMRQFERPIVIEGKAYQLTASVGVTYSDQGDDTTSQSLIRQADLAMYRAKEMGRNRVAYYSVDLEEKIQSQLLVIHQLQNALKQNELELYLQPKINLKTGKICGAEALLRWQKDGAFVSPAKFIPIAEENNLIKEIDIWVVQRAIDYLYSLQLHNSDDFSIAINISGRTFSDPAIMENLLNDIISNGCAKTIEIEITEGILIENLIMAMRMMRKIKAAGISLSLDDFGTGYSSFSYLSRMPLDSIKIDRSFVSSLHERKQEILTEAIISFSKKLGMKVIAEGIETPQQLEWLTARQCELAQGYLFSAAIPFEKFTALYKNNRSFIS